MTATLARLLAFASEVQRATTFEELLVTTRAEIEPLLGYTNVWLFAATATAGEWRLVELVGQKRGLVDLTAVVRGHPVLDELAATDRAVVIADARTDPRTNKTTAERLDARTFIHLPLRVRDAPLFVLGTGSFGDREGCRPPKPEELAYLEAMGSQVAAAAGRIRLQEASAKQSEARFRRLTESGIVGIVISDVAGNITEANDAFLEIVGYSRDDLLTGKVSGQKLNTPQRDRTDAAAVAQLRARGMARPWEKELIRKDGSRVPVLTGVVMLEETAGEYVAFVLDLSERKNAEAARAAVMEAALDAVVIMDHEGRIREFNPAAERTFGYSCDEVLGKLLADVLVPPSLRERHTEALRHYLATGEGRIIGKRIEVPALRRDGTEFPAEVAIVRIPSVGPALFSGSIRDITERRRAAEAEILQREKEAAEDANKELETFSYSVAHDLRTPLRGIGGFVGAFLEDHGAGLEPAGVAQLQRVIASATRMGEIIDALLSLAQLSRTELHRQTVNLAELARSIVDELRAAEPERVVELVAPDDVPADGDPVLLRTVLENLLANAWKFTRRREGARIELGADDDGYYVRDNGAGFNMDYSDKLFSPFQRLHPVKQFEGTGIGLAIVARIIGRHGGTISGKGAEGAGATFRFTLG